MANYHFRFRFYNHVNKGTITTTNQLHSKNYDA